MSMKDWAEREVEIACERERKSSGVEDGWDYGCACYESALKAYKSLMEDGHSGFSIGLTKNILVRLIEGKPLTPIEDVDDVWDDISRYNDDGLKSYQCKRMSSLFKNIKPDGSVKYSDVGRYYCQDINHRTNTYTSGLVGGIVDEMFPITFPYCPEGRIKVFCEELLTDRKNGDFDTVGIFYAIKPDGERVNIYRYFKEDADIGWKEITAKEYADRKKRNLLDWCEEESED